MSAACAHDRIRVLIADSQAVLRSGVRLVLEEQSDLTVVGEASDFAQAHRAVEALRPQVAIVELELPGAEPGEAAHRFAQIPNLGVIFLAGSPDAQGLGAALAESNTAILSKNAPMERLLDAIRSVGRGRRWQPAHLESRLEGNWSRLTPRERDVADLVARGLAYKDVASRLRISDHTVKNHLRSIYDKLDINSRVELAVHGADGARR